VSAVGGPKDAGIKKSSGDVIEDEGKRKTVTDELEAINGLSGDEKQDSKKEHQRVLEANEH
jgi:hypothetical protein